MHSTKSARSRRDQLGAMLLEALVATTLVGTFGLGLAYAAARSAAAQRTGNAQNLAVGALRSHLQATGFAQGCPLSGSNESSLGLTLAEGMELKSLKRTCTVDETTVTAGSIGKTVKVPHVEFRAVDANRFGSDEALLLKN